MLAIDDSASIFCAREMRGTMSIATTVAPLDSAILSILTLGGPEEGNQRLTFTTAAFQSAAADFTTSTPAAL
jgi:hypothetical protein